MTAVEFNLRGLLKIITEPARRSGARITLRHGGFTLTAWGDDMAYTLPGGTAVQVKVSYVDANGHPAKVDGEVEWASSDENILRVQTDDDDTSNAVISATGQTLGQAQITATADADLGEGVREVITPMDVEVVAGEAVTGTITPVGEPSPLQPTQVKRR